LRHLGVDLEAPLNTPVYAINDGIVKFAQNLSTYGKTIIIDHGFGIYSLYLHLNDFKVKENERVKRGEVIGLSGNTGYSLSPHLHFSIKIQGITVEPLNFIEEFNKIITKEIN
jgi:murein DD-endopeptidase MepM/ murein hydrolase activator NlpD